MNKLASHSLNCEFVFGKSFWKKKWEDIFLGLRYKIRKFIALIKYGFILILCFDNYSTFLFEKTLGFILNLKKLNNIAYE